MKILIWLLCQLSFPGLAAQVNKIEHFYVSSLKNNVLFHLFRDSLRLPMAWDYEKGSTYSSGGLSLGNVILEFSDHAPVDRTRFKGIGLEPMRSARDIEPILDVAKIGHDTIDAGPDYSIIMLRYLLPAVKLFICEYTYRTEYDRYKQRLTDTLSILQRQGPGINGLKEIVLGCKDLPGCRLELTKIPGIRRGANDLFSFNTGPALRLEHADSSGITKIVVLVSDGEATKEWLRQRKMLDLQTGDVVGIRPEIIDGLRVEFTDR